MRTICCPLLTREKIRFLRFTAYQRSCGKVMFSFVCLSVCLFTSVGNRAIGIWLKCLLVYTYDLQQLIVGGWRCHEAWLSIYYEELRSQSEDRGMDSSGIFSSRLYRSNNAILYFWANTSTRATQDRKETFKNAAYMLVILSKYPFFIINKREDSEVFCSY